MTLDQAQGLAQEMGRTPIMNESQMETCAGIGLMCDDEELQTRLRIAMQSDDAEESEHVTALIIGWLYGHNQIEAARFCSQKWQEAFKR